MDGKLFLGTARFLRSEGSDEAAYRSAVSRAYYACFLEARQLAFDNCPEAVRRKAGIAKIKGIKHDKLRTYLTNAADEAIRALGINLSGLCGNREDADYGMDNTLLPEDADGAINDAEAFLEALQDKAVAVGEAMKTYIETTYRG